MQTNSIDEITSRHVAKACNSLAEVNTPQCAIEYVRRHMWFLKDDIMEKVNQGDQNGCQEKPHSNS